MISGTAVIFSLQDWDNDPDFREFRQVIQNQGWQCLQGSRGKTVNHKLVATGDIVVLFGAFAALDYEYKKVRQAARQISGMK